MEGGKFTEMIVCDTEVEQRARRPLNFYASLIKRLYVSLGEFTKDEIPNGTYLGGLDISLF